MYLDKKGSRYEGYWSRDKQDGYGMEVWEDYSLLEADFVRGNKMVLSYLNSKMGRLMKDSS